MTMKEVYDKMMVELKEEEMKHDWNITEFAFKFYQENAEKSNGVQKFIDLFEYDFEGWKHVARFQRFFSLIDFHNWNTSTLGSVLVKNLFYFIENCPVKPMIDFTSKPVLKPECQSYINAVNEFFTFPGDDLSLPDMAHIFTAYDPRQVVLEAISDINESILNCFQMVSEELLPKVKKSALKNIDILEDQSTEYFSSPCLETEKYPQCNVYCNWHKKVLQRFTKKEFLTIMKYSLPQRKVIFGEMSKEEISLVKKLFGETYVKQLQNEFAPKTNVYLCHDMQNGFNGDKLPFDQLKVCNEFFLNPSDQGMCLTKNIYIKEYANIDEDYELLLETDLQQSVTKFKNQGLKSKITLVFVPDSHSTYGFKRQTYKRHHADNLGEFFLQIHPNGELAIMENSWSTSKEASTLKLVKGYSYFIDVTPRGQISTKAFQELDIPSRNCLLGHEGPKPSVFKIYKQKNCFYECHVEQAEQLCKCQPWDFIKNQRLNSTMECDIFGRYCFFKEMKRLAQSSINRCKHCLQDCNHLQFNKKVTAIENEKGFKFYDKNPALKHLKHLAIYKFQDEDMLYVYNMSTSGLDQRYEMDILDLFDQAIIVELTFWKPEFNIIDLKYNIFDKFANFGGNFGIFAEITGCSFLGMLNFFILLFKLLFCCCKNRDDVQ